MASMSTGTGQASRSCCRCCACWSCWRRVVEAGEEEGVLCCGSKGTAEGAREEKEEEEEEGVPAAVGAGAVVAGLLRACVFCLISDTWMFWSVQWTCGGKET